MSAEFRSGYLVDQLILDAKGFPRLFQVSRQGKTYVVRVDAQILKAAGVDAVKDSVMEVSQYPAGSGKCACCGR